MLYYVRRCILIRNFKPLQIIHFLIFFMKIGINFSCWIHFYSSFWKKSNSSEDNGQKIVPNNRCYGNTFFSRKQLSDNLLPAISEFSIHWRTYMQNFMLLSRIAQICSKSCLSRSSITLVWKLMRGLKNKL